MSDPQVGVHPAPCQSCSWMQKWKGMLNQGFELVDGFVSVVLKTEYQEIPFLFL